jgi:hexosaminidase
MTSTALIPCPSKITPREGEFHLHNASRIEAPKDLHREAGYLAAYLRRATGFPLPIADFNPAAEKTTAIRLTLDPGCAHLGEEGYRLTIGPDLVDLRAPASAGIFYGIQSLLQLFPPAIYGLGPRLKIEWKVPQLDIEDAPRFAWRGAMLDSCRHFRPVEFVRKFIDLLALHKLNIFHWHLTDDQGWRVEIQKYPKLTEISAWRNGTWMGHHSAESHDDGIRHGGFYTQEQIREIVRYAAERHITIVPEIEMPGHAQAALAAYPEFGCTGNQVEVRRRWGISENIYSPKEETFGFLQDVLLEVMELFPGRFIHIGGDEAVKKEWDSSPEIQALMASVGAKDAHEMQSYFIRRIDRFLTQHGRRLIGWDEILEGGLADGAAVMSWRGIEGGIAAATQGHDVVMAPNAYTYLDSYQSESLSDEPLAIGGLLPLEKVYGYEPMPANIPAEKIRHILGLQGQLWAEYMPSTEQVEYMAFPRLTALAEVAWSPAESRDYHSFLPRLSTHLKRLDVLQTRYRPPQR